MTLAEAARAELAHLPRTTEECSSLPEHHYEWLLDWQFRLMLFVEGFPGGDPERVAEINQMELEFQETALNSLEADPRNRWPRDQAWLAELRGSLERVIGAL